MTWARTGHFVGSWTSDTGYHNTRQILKRLKKKNTKELADILVVEENGWETKKVQIYKEANKIILPASEVYEYLIENYPEVIL